MIEKKPEQITGKIQTIVTSIACVIIIAACLIQFKLHFISKSNLISFGSLSIGMLCVMMIVVINFFFLNRINLPDSKQLLISFLTILFVFYAVVSFENTKGLKNFSVSEFGDTATYTIQAKMLLHGLIRAKVPHPSDFFETIHCINNGRWYFGKYPPGWPAILAIGVVSGIPWLLNPLLLVMGLLVLFSVGKKFYNESIAWTGLLLTCFSAITLWSAVNFFSEPLSFFLASAFIYSILSAFEQKKSETGIAALRTWIFWSIAAGLSFGVLALTRPQIVLSLAVPFALYWVWRIGKGERQPIWAALIILAFSIPLILTLLYYNQYLTDSPFRFPHSLYNPFDRIGFGLRARDIKDIPHYFGPSQIPENALREMLLVSTRTIPLSFLLTFVLLCSKKKSEIDWLLLGIVGFTTGFYLLHFVWMTAPRYHMPTMCTLALTSARGLGIVSDWLFKRWYSSGSGKAVVMSAFLFIILNLGVVAMSPGRPFFHPTQRLIADPLITIENASLSHSIVFIRTLPKIPGMSFPLTSRLYTQNAPDFNTPVLIAQDLGLRNSELVNKYPDRTCFFYDFDSLAQQGRLSKMDLTVQ